MAFARPSNCPTVLLGSLLPCSLLETDRKKLETKFLGTCARKFQVSDAKASENQWAGIMLRLLLYLRVSYCTVPDRTIPISNNVIPAWPLDSRAVSGTIRDTGVRHPARGHLQRSIAE